MNSYRFINTGPSVEYLLKVETDKLKQKNEKLRDICVVLYDIAQEEGLMSEEFEERAHRILTEEDNDE